MIVQRPSVVPAPSESRNGYRIVAYGDTVALQRHDRYHAIARRGRGRSSEYSLRFTRSTIRAALR